MDIYSLYATNDAHEEQGKPFTKEFGGEATFVIARAGNRQYNRMVQVQFKAHQHTLELKDTPAEEDQAADLSFQLIGKVLSRSVLLGWSGNVTYQKKPLPYSPENAELLLSHKDFRAKILGIANDYHNYLIEQEEVDVKNSVPISSGTSPGVPVSNTSET